MSLFGLRLLRSSTVADKIKEAKAEGVQELKDAAEKALSDLKKARRMNVEQAFKCDGVQYYRLGQLHDMPNERLQAALTYTEEYNLRLTTDYLKEYHQECTKQIEALRVHVATPVNGKLRLDLAFNSLQELDVRLKHLKERTELLISPETVYKIASVVLFTEEENLDSFDFSLGRKKIESWKKAGLDAFFLMQRLGNLINWKLELNSDLKTYMSAVEKIEDPES